MFRLCKTQADRPVKEVAGEQFGLFHEDLARLMSR